MNRYKYQSYFQQISLQLNGQFLLNLHWTVKKGSLAPQAAGVIHTDFEKGFIKAEVIKYDDFMSLGSELKCKEAGKLSIEGKEYIVKDGDIMHFRFNV